VVFGCWGSHLRCDSSTTKGARVIACFIKLLNYMMDGIGIPVCSCHIPVLTFHSQVGGIILAQCGFWLLNKPFEM
jgi:hypothetical protein